jgi:predicted ATPase
MAGERAFGGSYLLQVTAAALSATPDWSRLPDGTPDPVRSLLARCVEKDPAQRPQTMHEIRAALEMALGHRTSFETRISEAPARSNLPTDLSTFVGRELELAECTTLLQETRLLTLTGLGGSGKTRMALRIGRERMHDYDGGVWFVDLAPLADPERVPGAVAEALGLRDIPGETLVETLCAHLAGRRTLLILDNCEHVLAACSRLLERLLHECAHLGVVATSREGLGMDGEQIFAVRSLSTPDLKHLPPPAELLFFESVRLFVDRAALSRHDFHLTAENSQAVAEICCRLDGVPLALELAAARARVLTLEQIRAKLDDRFRLLTGGSKGSAARHQTLQAAMQWSYDQLVDEEKSLFRAFSVFADGWSLEAAAAVVGPEMDEFEVIDVLTRLVDKSLVQVDGVGGSGIRYHMLESVRQYAFERLEECGESFSRRERHLDYFLALAVARRAGLPPGEHDNAIAALEWASRTPEAQARALELAGTLAFFWRDRGHLELGARWLKSVLETCDAGQVSRSRAQACFGAATVSLERKRMDEASSLLDEAVALFRSLGDDSGLGRALNARAVVALIQGDTQTARGLLEESVAAFRRSPSPATASDALNNLAELAREEGDPERAYGLYEEALAVCAADATSRPVFLLNMAMISVTRRAFEPAREQLQACLEQVRVEMSSYAGAPALDVCGALAAAMRHSERAVRFYASATALLDKVGGTRDPLDQQTHEPLIAQLRQSLGEHRFAETDAAGRELTFEGALEEALEWLAAPGEPLPEPRPKTSRRATRQAPWP